MPWWAIALDLLILIALAVVAYLSAVMSYLGMGFAGRAGMAPFIFLGVLILAGLLIYNPMAIAHLLRMIPLPDWSHN